MTVAINRGRDEFIAFNKALLENQGQTQIEEETWVEVLALANSELHFSPLSDAEWAAVRASIQAAGCEEFDASSIRRAVDDAAVSSGYFAAFGFYNGPNRRTLSDLISNHKKIVQKAEDIISYIDDMEGQERLKYHLEALKRKFLIEINHYKRRLSQIPDPPPNAKTPMSIDRWGAYIVRVWKNFLGLPVTSGVRLQRFIVACASPYGRYVSEAQARRFLERYINGEVIDAGTPVSEALRK